MLDVSGYQTYDWLERPVTEIRDSRVDMEVLDARIRRAVDRELFRKGFDKSIGGKPDLLVGYRAALESKIRTSNLNESLGYRTDDGWIEWNDSGIASTPGGMRVGGGGWSYDVGTLIIDVVVAETKRLIWRGTARTQVHLNQSDQQREALVNEAVADIIFNFPAR